MSTRTTPQMYWGDLQLDIDYTDIEIRCQQVQEWEQKVRREHKYVTALTELLLADRIYSGYKLYTPQSALGSYPGTKAAMKPLIIVLYAEEDRFTIRRSEYHNKWYIQSRGRCIRGNVKELTEIIGMLNQMKMLALIAPKDTIHIIK